MIKYGVQSEALCDVANQSIELSENKGFVNLTLCFY
jgi:hypothetical protein